MSRLGVLIVLLCAFLAATGNPVPHDHTEEEISAEVPPAPPPEPPAPPPEPPVIKEEPPVIKEVICHVCGKKSKINAGLVHGEFYRCDRCSGNK